MILSLSDIVWEEMGIRIVGNISINTIPQNTSLYGDVKRVFVEDFDLAYPINHFWMQKDMKYGIDSYTCIQLFIDTLEGQLWHRACDASDPILQLREQRI